MTNASFQYKLIIVPHARDIYNTSNIHHTFDSLLSGTSYNISVATVGVMGFESAEFQLNMVTTSKDLIYVSKHQHFHGLFHLFCLVIFKSLNPLSYKQDHLA